MGPVLATGMVLSWSFLLQLWLPNTEEWYEDVDEIPVFSNHQTQKVLRPAIRACQAEAEKRPVFLGSDAVDLGWLCSSSRWASVSSVLP